MITRKVGPALAAGCSVVLKPAEATPLSALALAELAERAGVPKGVFNVLTGDPIAIGGELCANPTVRKLSFTGSTEVGSDSHAAVCADDQEAVARVGRQRTVHRLRRCRSRCRGAGSDALQVSQYGPDLRLRQPLAGPGRRPRSICRKTRCRSGALRVGNGIEEGVTQGPLIDDAAIAKVEELVADALGKGARVVCGGKPHSLGGTYYEPTILAGVTAQMRIAREEVFGPVAPVFAFKTEADAVAMANDTEYGLASYFYTENLARSLRVASALEYGMVGINTGLISTELAPFGGMKSSGLGREGSKYGIEDYLEIKYICIGGIV
jgi:succinate-semialdehyde dehydrogenase/glutarate-semialdehyde dehydrogenase